MALATAANRQQSAPPAQAPPPSEREKNILKHYIALRDRAHNGPFYTVLNDGMKTGLKRKGSEMAPTDESLFDPFLGNETYSARYHKKQRKLPKLDTRPFGELTRAVIPSLPLTRFRST